LRRGTYPSPTTSLRRTFLEMCVEWGVGLDVALLWRCRDRPADMRRPAAFHSWHTL
jgi:steroid 5-alpha reductase family enzyme